MIGSFLLDKLPPHPELFSFKHHYITSAMDSEITCSLLTAMGEKRNVTMRVVVRKSERITERQAVPLRIRISVQNGRQYLLAYLPRLNRIASIRIDSILSVRPEEPCLQYGEHCLLLERMLPHLWGTSMPSSADQALEHIAFTVEHTEEEAHIPQRLEREKRCGTVESIGGGLSRFSADVYDAMELLPWVKTFICRITQFECSNRKVEARFREELEQMYGLYGLEGGGKHGFQ